MAASATAQRKAKSRTLDYWVLVATISAGSMAYVASTALNVALPAIQRDLNARAADLLWISNSYVIMQASLLIVCGSLADRYGRNRLCMLGIVFFAIASLVAGTAQTVELLIVARFAQGIGGAMIISCTLAIVSAYFKDDRHGWGIGIWSAFTLLTSGLGPFVGGVLTELGIWRAVFFVHMPFGVLAAWVLWRYVPESYDKNAPKRMRLSGTLLVTLALLGLTYGFMEAPQFGFEHPGIRSAIVLGIVMLLAFIYGEYRADDSISIIPLDLFKIRTFSGANLGLFLLYAGVGPILIYVPLNMIQIQGYSETFVGIAIFPMTILMLVFSAYIGGIVDRYGPRTPIVIGHCLLLVGYILMARIGITGGQDDYWFTFFPPICLSGIGLGITLAPLAVAVMGSVDETKAGIASGISNTLSRVGQVLAVAIMGGFMLTLFTQTLLESPAVQDLPDEMRKFLAIASVDMAETTIPESLGEAERSAVSLAIDTSYIDGFNMLVWFGAAMTAIGGLVCWLTIDNRLVKRKEDVT